VSYRPPSWRRLDREDEALELGEDAARISAANDSRFPWLADFECRVCGEIGCLTDHTKERTMTDMLNDLAPTNGEKPKLVPCIECGADAPRFGKYAGRCPEHRVKAERPKRRKVKAAPGLVLVPQLESPLGKAALRYELAKGEYEAAKAALLELLEID